MNLWNISILQYLKNPYVSIAIAIFVVIVIALVVFLVMRKNKNEPYVVSKDYTEFTDCRGRNIGENLTNKSLDDMKKLCDLNPECKGFSYNQSTGQVC